MIRGRSSATPVAGLAQWPLALRSFLLGLLAVTLALPAGAATNRVPAPKKPRVVTEAPLIPSQAPDDTRFSFTASGGSSAGPRSQSVERAFRFTPSGRNLSVGLAARVTAPAADRSRAGAPIESGLTVAPTAYSADLSVAWHGFTVSTAISHAESGFAGLPGVKDAVGVGIGYSGRNWRTRLQGNAEEGSLLYLTPSERRYSFELGGSYLVAPRLSLTGGVRYRLPSEQPSLLQPKSDDRAVYVGTSIAF